MTSQTERTGRSSGSDQAGPAVVYFAKAPVPGQVKTRLCPPLSEDEAAALYGAFLRRVVRPVAAAKTLVYGWPAEELPLLREAMPDLACSIEIRAQQGEDLFERMANCVDELFAEGHSQVLVRNTDSPDLEVALVEEALALCTTGSVVLGPDLGGGYYLVALAQPLGELFTGMDGLPETVFEATCAKAAAAGREVKLLAPRGDVDTFDDLIAMWHSR